MTQNFVPTYVNEKLGSKTMKLSMEGSTSKEHYLIANLAMGTGKVKKVIWGLDYFSLRGGKDMVRDDQGGFPYYLYDNNIWNDQKYLFNISTVKDFAKTYAKDVLEGGRKAKNLDKLNNWDAYANYSAERVLKNWNDAKVLEVSYGKNEDSLDSVKETFHQNIYSLVKSHPEIEFVFYYPPYSVLRQQVWYQLNPKRYENQEFMKKYMVNEFSKLPNATVYDFQSLKEITFDLNKYKDISHHSQQVNEFIIDSIAAGKYQATPDNIEHLNAALDEQVRTLDVSVFDSVEEASVKQ
jgi:hypothetical protein